MFIYIKYVNFFIAWIIWIVPQPWFPSVISSLTIPILAWTAWEALKTSRATIYANNLKLLPLLGIYFHQNRNRDESFNVMNLGEGVAYNIKIDIWTLIFQDVHEIYELHMSIPGTNILSRGEEKEINTKIYVNGRESNISRDFALAFLRGYNAAGIQLRFKDATGRENACLIGITGDSVNIIKPTYKVTLLSRISFWYGMKVERVLKIKFEKMLWGFEERRIGITPNYRRRIYLIVKNFIVKKLRNNR